MPFCTNKTWNFLVTHFFVEELSIFFTAFLISDFLTAAMKFSCFFFQRNSSPLFLITHSSTFSVIHVSVDVKNNVEKDTTLLLFFLSESPGGHASSRQKHLDLPVVSYLFFNIGMPVVRTDGQTYGYVITKIYRMDGLPNYFRYGPPLARTSRAWSSATIYA